MATVKVSGPNNAEVDALLSDETLAVLGTPLLVTDYVSLGERCQQWAHFGQSVAVDFVNTQIVSLRRHDSDFRSMSDGFDFFVPDGMPLIWCMNTAGAEMRDRVYGPTFMREFLNTVPGKTTHYLLGGSEECGKRLRERFTAANPGVKFVGGFHGKCRENGTLEAATDRAVVDEINDLSPDYIWVGLGAPKQQRFIQRHKKMIRRGVMLSVGFGFDVNAGLKPDAPPFMQKAGLTWVFRLLSEPKRLAGRYIKCNSLFLYYLLVDSLRGRAVGSRRPAEIELVSGETD